MISHSYSMKYGRFRVVRSGLRWCVEDSVSNLAARDALILPFWRLRAAQQCAMVLHLTRCHAYDEARDDVIAQRGATP